MAFATSASQHAKNAHYRVMFQRYVDAIAGEDVERIVELFADNAVLEDPYGSEHRFEGRDELRAFFTRVTAHHVRLRIVSHCTGSMGNGAAMPMEATADGTTMSVVSVAQFDDDGLIARYQAYWGPGDFPDDVPMPGEGIL